MYQQIKLKNILQYENAFKSVKKFTLTLKMSFDFLSQKTFLYIVEDSLISISSIIQNNVFDVITCQIHIFSVGHYWIINHFVKI